MINTLCHTQQREHKYTSKFKDKEQDNVEPIPPLVVSTNIINTRNIITA